MSQPFSNMLSDALAWHVGQAKAFFTVPITYFVGDQSIPLMAILENEILRVEDGEGGTRIQWVDKVFVVPVDDLNFGDGPINPQRGHIIKQTLNDGVHTYEVLVPGREAPYRESDGYDTYHIIRTKQVGLPSGSIT
jgi:hypothetical protein